MVTNVAYRECLLSKKRQETAHKILVLYHRDTPTCTQQQQSFLLVNTYGLCICNWGREPLNFLPHKPQGTLLMTAQDHKSKALKKNEMELLLTIHLWLKHEMRRMFIWNLRSVLWAAHIVAFIPALTVKSVKNTIQFTQPHTVIFSHQGTFLRMSASA